MLEDYSNEQLQVELDRRKRELIEADKPKVLPFVNIVPLQILCQDYIDQINEKGHVNSAFKRYIFETAMETIFGKDIWDWISENIS